ncbi:hypothetical protein [Thaumasiovibrio sp. DFM-14]|uniref:hypothetical protein n=1 Tax=Thaumasiovibrio sp. DFM-14 TaxID=3384792 RepID=UPI00399F307F
MKIKALIMSLVVMLLSYSPLALAAKADPILHQPLHSEMSFDKAKKLITIAAAKRKWVVSEESDGVLVGNLQVRSHFVSVEIRVQKNSYDILYRDSENMKYRPDGTIHRKYNGWVGNLNRDIQSDLLKASL